ncbi:hypothetical protein OSG_eHP1_00210 [environmental Halophage eHP-1]|nr:hypothetical protein OSG_eHP1_00210 [environmental Halophage eHP-1]AFH22221.1 hypothetical protein OSG_eHP19_00080 [environmental Halophage eHP-19]
MSTNYAQTPADKLRKPKGEQDGKQQVHVTDWCSHHDVYMWLMPFDYRTYDPLEACEQVQTTIKNLPRYAQTFMLKDTGITNLAGTHMIKPILDLYAITELRDTSKGQRYNNPEYEHYDACITPVEDMDSRKQMYERYRRNPFLTGEWYGKHWGVTRKSAMNFIRRWGYSIRKDRDTARKRLGRTLHTINLWRDDLTQKEIVSIMPANYNTVRDYIKRFAINAEEWQPPERPTHKPWFRSN